jgi:hypothetical protein
MDMAAPNEPGRRRATPAPILPLRAVMSERATASLTFGCDGAESEELECGKLAMTLNGLGGGPNDT